MVKFCYSHKGAISVFLLLVLLPMFILAGVIIDGSRIYASRNIVSGAGDLTMNAALADYDTVLKDMYSLFAMANDKASDDKLEQYFKESINSGNLSYGNYDNLPVFLTLEGGLSVDRVENTESYQTQVMKQQVLEYSKYRIPVLLITSGLLDGMDVFEGMDDKVDAIKSQLTFEEELTDLQQLLEDLNEYLDKQDKLYAYFTQEYPNIIDTVKKNYNLVAKLYVAYKALLADTEAEEGALWDLMSEYVSLSGQLTKDYAGSNDYQNSSKALSNFEKLWKMKKINKAIDDPNDIFVGLSEGSDEWKEAENLLENYAEASITYIECETALTTAPDDLMSESQELLFNAYQKAENGIEYSEEIVKISEKIKEKNSDGSSLKNAHKDFGEKISKLNDEQMKQPMQKEYNDYDRLLDNDNVDALISKTENNNTFYNEIKIGIENITFCDVQIYITYENMTFLNAAGDYSTGVTTDSGVQDAGQRFYGDKFKGSDFTTSVSLEDLSKEEFYAFVKEKCETESVSDAEKQARIEETNANLEKGKDSKTLIDSDDVATDPVEGLEDAPTVWLENASHTDNDAEIDVEGSADSKSSRKKSSKAAKNSLNQVSEQTSGLSSLSDSIVGGSIANGAMHVVESFLVTGYESTMFSYLTVDKDENGNSQEKESLTGYKFSSGNNVMYKSEMEYMLFGNSVPAKNVRNSKASLYAIRFGLNAIGAFSNSTLRAEADAAAVAITGGMASFALPLARSVVILGTTCVETYKDMQNLLNGKAVTVLKFNGSWHIYGYDDGGSNGFKLNYYQYLILFLVVNNLTNSGMTQSMARTADCIELNVRNKGSTMKDKQTMLTLDAIVGVRTSFMKNAVAQINSQGGVASEINDNDYNVRYHGILAY